MSQTIKIYNLGNLPTASLDDFCELQEDFKISDTDKLMKLALLIMTRGFKYSFKAWRDEDGKLWIIDAHQRKKALSILRSRGVIVPDIPYEPIYAADKREAVEEIAQCCVWVKNSIVMGRQDYQWKHEPILYGWKEGVAHKWYADRSQSTVWNFDRPMRNDIHPTMKPIALISYPLLNSSKIGDLVVDLFSGSGSTIMACEQHKRVCSAMEIDPLYADATVQRYINAVGLDEVYLQRDGKTIKYAQINDC